MWLYWTSPGNSPKCSRTARNLPEQPGMFRNRQGLLTRLPPWAAWRAGAGPGAGGAAGGAAATAAGSGGALRRGTGRHGRVLGQGGASVPRRRARGGAGPAAFPGGRAWPRSGAGRPGASPPGRSGCTPPGTPRHAPGSGRRSTCLGLTERGCSFFNDDNIY